MVEGPDGLIHLPGIVYGPYFWSPSQTVHPFTDPAHAFSDVQLTPQALGAGVEVATGLPSVHVPRD